MKLKIYILILYSLSSFQCKEKHIENSNRIYYQTGEFSTFEKKAFIKFDEANHIFLNYLKEKNIKLTPVFLFCEGDDYIFGVETDPSKDKMNRVWKIYKLKINSQNGNIEAMEGQVRDESLDP